MTDDEQPAITSDLYTILNHLGEDRAQWSGAVSPPIFQSAMFCFESVTEMRSKLADELRYPFYTRGHNPTVAVLRKKLAALESTEDCLAFASGSAAIAAAVLSQVSQGDEILCVAQPYSWTGKLLSTMLPRFGVHTRFVTGGQVADFEPLIGDRTRMLVLESPNSMTFTQQDLAGLAALARHRNITTLCDNSYATPLGQQPAKLGIDLVAHSATKYLNGHSDAIAGALCGSERTIRQIFEGPFMTLGGIISPHDAWLLIRGLRSLPLRLQAVRTTTASVIEYLDRHPRVRHIYYPGRAESGGGSAAVGTGLLSIELDSDDVATVERFCDRLQRFLLTCSWGGYESLAFPMCALSNSENYQGSRRFPVSLVRLSIGLEPAEILIEDLHRALAE